MPLYEYTCQGCGSRLELLVRDGQKPSCTSCGSSQLNKEWSVPAAHSGGGLPIRNPSDFGGCGKPGCGPGGCGRG